MGVTVAAVVPAAGRSQRFGRMKLVEHVGGEPLLNRTLRCLFDAAVAPVVVVCSPGAALESVTLLRHPVVQVVVNPDPARGMFSSIQTGLAVVGDHPVLVLPADMPYVSAETVARVADRVRSERRVVVPVHGGRRGHPIGLPARLLGQLVTMDPTVSLKTALVELGEEAQPVDVDDPGVCRDVDRPEDLAEEGV